MDHTEILDAGTQQGLEVLKEFSGGVTERKLSNAPAGLEKL